MLPLLEGGDFKTPPLYPPVSAQTFLDWWCIPSDTLPTPGSLVLSVNQSSDIAVFWPLSAQCSQPVTAVHDSTAEPSHNH